jgi:hypothetical protein
MNLNQLKPMDGHDGSDDPSLSGGLDGSGEGGLGELALAAAPRKRLSLQTIIVIITIAASAGALYMMRQKGKAAGLKLQPIKLDLDVDKLPKPRQDHQRILSDLALGTVTPAQQDKLEKNPFRFENLPSAEFRPATGAQSTNIEAERLRYALAAIEINAIMQGRVPVARINGKLVQVGDTVEDVLKVVQIHERSIEFSAGGDIYTVQMGERGQPRPTPPRPSGSQQPQPPQPRR